jgi:hypothetical protein
MAGTTTNFGFDYPTSTDYVKDGATAIQELADDVDARFGDDANYPDQIVNVVSGVSRPVPYAMAAGTITLTGSATITFPVGRFTVGPLLTANGISTNNTITSVTFGSPTSASVTAYAWTGATASTTNRSIHYHAIQMTSTTAAG